MPGKITERLNELAEPDTVRGTLRHQLAAHKMTCADLADAAILPETLVAAGLDGTGAISPAQLVRCAPVLQMPEDVLLACLGGGRDRHYWPLPRPIRIRSHPAPEAEAHAAHRPTAVRTLADKHDRLAPGVREAAQGRHV
ncbi:hypothetical protein ABT285_29595 [Streptomyces microflavus]|uniref:hypothetical protein n=1 Tax=Streptomyces microflavus TaxID=1919 RepID=UPI0033208C62